MSAEEMHDSTRAMFAGRPLWQRSLGYGVLWSGVITAGEMLSLPFGHLGLAAHLMLMANILITWIPAGICIAWFGFAAGKRGIAHWPAVLMLFLLLALALTALQSGAWWIASRFQLRTVIEGVLGENFPNWNLFFYVLWMTLFHGALFTVGCMLALRNEQTRRLLGGAQIARGRSDALLANAQLEALRTRIDPAFLLRAMAEIQRRYGSDADAADHLLDELVGFLRSAMPGVRSGSSTLGDELHMARDYAVLAQQIDPTRGQWRFDLPSDTPELAFPPLLLLPLVEALTPSDRNSAPSELALRCDTDLLTLTVRADDASGLTRALSYRLRVALQAQLGAACTLRIERAPLPEKSAVLLQLTLSRTAQPEADADPGATLRSRRESHHAPQPAAG